METLQPTLPIAKFIILKALGNRKGLNVQIKKELRGSEEIEVLEIRLKHRLKMLIWIRSNSEVGPYVRVEISRSMQGTVVTRKHQDHHTLDAALNDVFNVIQSNPLKVKKRKNRYQSKSVGPRVHAPAYGGKRYHKFNKK